MSRLAFSRRSDGASGPQQPAAITVVEHLSAGYAPRTQHNANSAGLTVAIAADFTTAGEKLTARLAVPRYLAIPIALDPALAGVRLAKAMRAERSTTLNVAGNGIHTLAKAGWTQARVNQHVYETIATAHTLLPMTQLVTGGQTGVDIAGAIAAHKLGIPALVTMPRGFRQRGIDGVDYSGTADGVTKQIADGAAALASRPAAPGAITKGICPTVDSAQQADGGLSASDVPESYLPPATLAQEAIERAAASRLTPLEHELAERLEELLEYSDNLRGAGVHKRCLDVLRKAQPINTGSRE